MRVMLLGDYHGNNKFMIDHVIPAAIKENVNCILQVGDFGYYEHYSDVKHEIDALSCELQAAGIPMSCIQGNHDKISYLLSHYQADEHSHGFVRFRKNMFFIPNGTRWTWGGKKFIALGGAYSIDKPGRLKIERKYELDPGTEWFPEEEMSDEDVARILAEDSSPVDVMITHDAPSSVNMSLRLKDIPECLPNRQRITLAVHTLTPRLLVHGHFHHKYEDEIRAGYEGKSTKVIGLGADVSNNPADAWEILELPANEDN